MLQFGTAFVAILSFEPEILIFLGFKKWISVNWLKKMFQLVKSNQTLSFDGSDHSCSRNAPKSCT